MSRKAKHHIKWRKKYQKFLQSPFWKDLTQRKILSSRGCERCRSNENLASHHRFYRSNWWDTKLSDLVVLCNRCHSKEHGLGVRAVTKRSQKPMKAARLTKKATLAQEATKSRLSTEDFEWWKRDRWQNQFAVSSRPEVTVGVP